MVAMVRGKPDPDGLRAQLAARLRQVEDEEFEAWAAAEPPLWVLTCVVELREAGLTPAQAMDLHRRLDDATRPLVGLLVQAGRMAALDGAYLHWWAASGLLRVVVETDPRNGPGRPRRPRKPSFTRWVNEARRFIRAAGGDQELAALAAAAGYSPAETETRQVAGRLDKDEMQLLVALRESSLPVPDQR